MTSWLLEDPADSEHMLDCKTEQHQVHRFVSHHIVLIQSFVCRCHQLSFIIKLFVGAILNTKIGHNISKRKTTPLIKILDFSIFIQIKMFEKDVESCTERSSSCFLAGIHHPHAVIVINQAVAEDSRGFMSPKTNHLI